MEILIISLIMILIAPAIYLVMQKYGRGRMVLLDRIVFLVVAAIVLFELLTHSFESAGFWALLMVGLGWLIPYLFEAHWHSMTERIHIVPIFLVCIGIVIHGLIDGIAIATPHGLEGAHQHDIHFLPWAVVIHQLPFAIFIWWFLFPRKGWPLPTLVLSLLAVSCVVGYAMADSLMPALSGSNGMNYNLFQALVAGSLLHVAFHRGHEHEGKPVHQHHHHH